MVALVMAIVHLVTALYLIVGSRQKAIILRQKNLANIDKRGWRNKHYSIYFYYYIGYIFIGWATGLY